MEEQSGLVKSASRVLDILELLSHYANGLTIKEISTALDFPQSSTFNLIQTMYLKGYLNESPLKRFKLSAKIVQIGTKALEGFDLYLDAPPLLQGLVHEVNETVFMAVLSEAALVYIAKYEGNRSMRISAQIGSKRPLHCTGLGKIFLAHLPEPERQKILADNGMPGFTKNTVTAPAVLEQQLKLFRMMGYSVDDEEIEDGVGCFAAPIFDNTGSIVAAISVSGPRERVFQQREKITVSLCQAAKSISYNLGYQGK